MIKVGGRKILYGNHKVIISIWNKDELPEELKESIIILIYRMSQELRLILRDSRADSESKTSYIHGSNTQHFRCYEF